MIVPEGCLRNQAYGSAGTAQWAAAGARIQVFRIRVRKGLREYREASWCGPDLNFIYVKSVMRVFMFNLSYIWHTYRYTCRLRNKVGTTKTMRCAGYAPHGL